MTGLIIACLAFLIFHLGISSSPLRGSLIGMLGENGYLGLYSLLAAASLAAMIYTWSGIEHSAWLWQPSPVAWKVTKILMLFSIVLLVTGTLTKNPVAVKMEGALDEEPAGILKITRHPTQWAILLYAVAHLISNGDEASVVLFGTLALLSGIGMFAIDRRKQASGDARWNRFFETTSLVPFAALLAGRTTLRLSEINWYAVALGVILYGCIYWFHHMVSGGASLF